MLWQYIIVILTALFVSILYIFWVFGPRYEILREKSLGIFLFVMLALIFFFVSLKK